MKNGLAPDIPHCERRDFLKSIPHPHNGRVGGGGGSGGMGGE